MKSRFFIGKDRYNSLSTSRYKDFTYGGNGFYKQNEELNNDHLHGTYGALLFDKRWIAKRTEIIERDNARCVICQDDNNLQVHHRQYHFIKSLEQFKPPWDYENNLLITLCERCHSKGHSKYKVPNVYI